MSRLIRYKSVEEMMADPWAANVSRGDVQCKYVTPNDTGFLCCMYKEGHEAAREHHMGYLVDYSRGVWIHRPDLDIFQK